MKQANSKAELRERIKESQQDPTHVWVKESPTKSSKKIKIDDQPKINKIFKPKTSIEYDVSKLVAHDGLTFNQVTSSSFIQAHLECTHKKTLKSSNTISSMVRIFSKRKLTVML